MKEKYDMITIFSTLSIKERRAKRWKGEKKLSVFSSFSICLGREGGREDKRYYGFLFCLRGEERREGGREGGKEKGKRAMFSYIHYLLRTQRGTLRAVKEGRWNDY